MQIGIHYSRFPVPPGSTRARSLAETARAADQGGAALFTVMDHYFQMEHYGGPPEPMLEGYTTLGLLAGITESVELGLLVTGVTYRHPGLLAKIDGLQRCAVSAAQAGTCAAATEVGTVSATAGQGSTPGTFGGGKVYLVDAPTSSDMVALGISLPVQVGPVDLGKVNVVAPVKLRSDYGIDITADVPTSIKGIPMYLRSLTVNVTKSSFLFNPSTCATRNATMTMTSASYAGSSSTANASSISAGNPR